MRVKRNFEWGKGKYYFTIKSFPTNITIYRKTKDAAKLAFMRYKQVGKDVEWHGKWNGKEFTETSLSEASATA